MRIIHVASYKDAFFNGIKSVLEELVPGQRSLGHTVIILNHEKNERPVVEGEHYVHGRNDFKIAVKDFQPDIVVFHSLYNIDDVRFSWYLDSQDIPYLVEPHGGTTNNNAKKNWLKKKIANLVYTNRFINKAAGIIYLNPKEADECVFKDYRRSFAIIPNGTKMHGRPSNAGSKDGKIRFMFLARIDIVHKGLDLLFPAIKQFNASGFMDKAEFHFYGKARNPKWKEMFEKFISDSDDNVFFHGPVDGDLKEDAFLKADVFLLTSRYEGMPMSVLEALSYGLPCLITPQTNMESVIIKGGCGWLTSTDSDNITEALIRAMRDYSYQSNKYIENALKAASGYTWDAICKYSIDYYSSIINDNISVPLKSGH